MSASIDRLVRDLRNFSQRKEMIKLLRKEMREPVPQVRRDVRASALRRLPRSGGLNKWAARTRVTASVTVGGSGVRVRVTGQRKNRTGMADIRRLDQGRTRHPSWGRRFRGQWHLQSVTPGFFSDPVEAAAPEWRAACDAAIDRAIEVIARG